jgi:hypothetical protein
VSEHVFSRGLRVLVCVLGEASLRVLVCVLGKAGLHVFGQLRVSQIICSGGLACVCLGVCSGGVRLCVIVRLWRDLFEGVLRQVHLCGLCVCYRCPACVFHSACLSVTYVCVL